MSSKWRRFEVMLPRRFNDGREVPSEWIAEAIVEISDQFGAASHETQNIEGLWKNRGVLYRDDLTKIVVDLPDLKRNRTWMKEFKARWKSRLEQLEIWMVSYRIEIE